MANAWAARLRAPSTSSVTSTGNVTWIRGSGRPASAAAWRIVGIGQLAEHLRADAPRRRAIGQRPGDPQHLRTERGDEHDGSGGAGHVDRPVHAELLAVEGHRLPSSSGISTSRYSRRWRTGLSNDRPHMLSTTIWWDRPMPRHSRPPRGGLHRQRLLGQHHRVPRVRRHHRGAQLDARHLPPDDGQRGQRVVAEDLRHPVRVEAAVGGLPRLVDHRVQRAAVDRPTHQS